MKRLLLSILMIISTFAVSAQCADSVTVFYENFDGPTIKTRSSTSHIPEGSDWNANSTVSVSPNNCMHSPLYTTSSLLSQLYIDTIRYIPGKNKIYLLFDHINKVHQLDQSFVSYRFSTGGDATSGYIYSAWTNMVFTHTSPNYYGNANTTDAIVAGRFSHNTYPTLWQATNNNAVPNNTWWKSELIDISQYIIGTGGDGQVFEIRFYTNRVFTSSYLCPQGWFLDNIKIIASDKELIPPKIALATPTVVNNFPNYGPYTIKATITDLPTNATFPDSVKLIYNENGGPWITTAPKTQLSATQYQWTLPQQCNGNVVRYIITARDLSCNIARPIDTSFTVVQSTTGITSNGARLMEIYNQPFSIQVGTPTPVSVVIRNRSNDPMTTALITTTLNNVPQPSYNWSSITDFNPVRPFCLDFRDTLTIGSYLPVAGWDTLRVCITQRNGAPNNFNPDSICAQYIRFGCAAILSGPLTIGGTGADFPSLNAFYTTLKNCGMNGSITARLAPGTYSSSLFFFDTLFAGQSALNTITFESLTGNPADVTILDDGTIASRGAITFDGVVNGIGHMRFKNLTIQGKIAGTWSRGVYINGKNVTNIKIENCIINVETPTSTSTNYAGISRVTASSGTIGDGEIEIKRNTINGGVYGIHYLGSSTKINSIISIDSNTINSTLQGIYLNYTNVPEIKKNNIKQLATSLHRFTGIHLERSATTSLIAKNKIWSDVNTNVGININNVSNGTTGDVLVTNNEINGKATVASTYGINNTLSTRMKYLHNSIRIYSTTTLAVTACYYHTSGAIVEFRNNLLVNDCVSLTSQNYPIYYAANPTTLIGDFNVYHSDGPVGYYTVARNNMAEWRLALGNTRDTATISIEPPFINSTISLKLADYAGFECPQNILVEDDIQDSLRECEVTHRGCYRTYVPPKDLALSQLLSPVLGTCPVATYPITLKVFNYGCSTVNFANTPATIRTIATGGLTLNTTYTINTGTLAPNQFSNITINPGVAIPYNVNINFTFIMTYTGDERTTNDTLSIPFRQEVIAPSIATYDETFSNGTTLSWKFEQITGAGNWSFQEGTGVFPAIAPVYGTGRLYFNSKNFATGTSSRAVMPVIDLTNSVTPILEVWYAHDNLNTAGNYATEGVTVKISTDGGLTWLAINPETPNPTNTTTSLLKRGQTAITGYTLPAWIKYTYDLSAYNTNSCVFISFEALGKVGNNINIDRVRLRKIYNNDCAVQNIYTTHVRPTTVETSPQVKAIITNEGRNLQINVQVTLTISGSNTYTETTTVATIPYNGQAVATFTGDHLANVGMNNIQISCQNDDYNFNNSANAILNTNTENLAYADTNSYLISFGSGTPIKAAVKYNVIDTVIATSVKFYPTNPLETVGKRIRAFISDANGNIITTSDIVTMTADMVNNWVTVPINNYALTHTSTLFYAGIEMVDAGYYLTAQLESPTRDDAFYYLNNDVYTSQSTGRFMIGATVQPKIDREFAILSLINPITNCDLVVEPITVRIANNGPKDILPGTTLHYTVNNGPVVTQAITDTIFSHQIRSFSFTTPYNFTNNQINIDDNYTVKVWTDATITDIVSFNDTLQKLIVSKGKAHLPISPDTILVNYSTNGTLTSQLPTQINPGIIQWFTKIGNQYVGPLYQGAGPYVTPNLIYYDTTYYVSVAPGVLYTNTVGAVTTANSQLPFAFGSGFSRGRILYKQSEVGNFGVIAKIALNVNTAASGILGIPIKIYIKQTDLDTLKTTDPFDWDNEIADATLVLDAQKYFNSTGWIELPINIPLNYTSGNILIYTESNCSGLNCGAISGGTVYPTFKTASAATSVQSKTANTNPVFTGTWGAPTANRWVVKFFVADMTCASERIPVQIHVPDKPNYDIQTEAFAYPVTIPAATTNCALYQEHIKVIYKNLLDNSIPANKVLAKAGFRDGTTGAYTWITHLITDSFAPLEEKEVIFTQTYDFSAPTANRTIQFIATSDLVNEPIVFRLNDTITGSIASTRTVTIPDQITYFGNFTQTFQIIPGITSITQYYFYDSEFAVSTLPNGSGVLNYTTTNLYDTTVYYMTAKTPAAPNCITKRIPITINVAVPTNNHDLKTNQLVFPISYTCGLMSPNLIVNYNNTDSVIIPTNTFKVTAKFTGTTNVTVVDTITPPFAAVNRLPVLTPQPTYDIVFNNPATLGSTLQNRTYNYEIFTDAVSPSYLPYRLNDTIRGSLLVPANPTAPANLTYTVPYGQTLTITPLTNPLNSGTPLNKVTLYNATGTTPIATGTSFVTPNIYAPTTYKYGGRIISVGFEKDSIVGTTSTTNGSLPFVFTQTESQGAVLFRKGDMGGYVGFIDTVSIYVHASITGSFPIQIYLKNTDSTSIPGGTYDWSNYFLNGATLIYDTIPEFTVGWLKIPIPGGFYYTGNSLLMLTSHNCFGENNVAALNISPSPTFKYATVPANPNLVLSRGGATPTAPALFTASTQRISTRFSINYTCESPKANITINTTIPSVDLHVTAITAPITPNNSYPANQIVTTTIKNNGTSNASGIIIGYRLGNNPPVEQPFSGAIAAGASSNFSFSTPVDLSDVYFSTPFIVYTRHATDPLQANDTLRIFLKKFDPCYPIVVVGARDTIGAHISKFKFAGIDNGPGTPIFNCPASITGNGKYSNFTETVAPGFVVRGQSFPITIVNSFTTNAGATLWKYVYLDMNRDNEFTANELIFSKLSVPSPTPTNQANATTSGFTLPVDINSETGLTRLRVITATQNLSTTAAPCAAFAIGETEDYAINISDPFSIDPGSTHILHPVGNVCSDNAAKIKVVIKNFGSSDLIITPSEPLIVNATVTRGTIVTPYSITITSGMVAQWDTLIAVIHNVNLDTIGNYVIDANIQYTSDQFVINNVASSLCEVTSTLVHTLPISINFDADDYEPGADTPFPQFWNSTTTHTTFKWDVDSLGTTNAPDAGPSFDHTFYQHYLQNVGQYAVVSAPANSNVNAVATLSTGCINLHYKDGYPCESDYWEHIFGTSSATSKFFVEIGSGEYYIRMDSIIGRTHTGINQEFLKRNYVMNAIDENARIRYIVTGRTGKIDPAIDDLSIKHGKADISIPSFVYPLDFTVSSDDCVIKKDTVRPTIIIKNVGRVPILNFTVNFNAAIGTSIQISPDESWTGVINPGDSIEYTYTNGIVVPELFSYLQFQAQITTINDENTQNNIRTITACTRVGIDDNVQIQNGIILGQNIPNPATNETVIPFYTSTPGITLLQIHSIEGQLLYTTTHNADMGDNNIQINTSNFAAGIYMYTITLNNTMLTRKMIIQK